MDALWDEGRQDRLVEILKLTMVTQSSDSAVVDMRTKYQARLGI